MWIQGDCSIAHCTFLRNVSPEGAAAWVAYYDGDIRNCTFWRNEGAGGSIYFEEDVGDCRLDNCILAGTVGGPGIGCCWLPPVIHCCDKWDNEVMTDCMYEGYGNFTADPEFCNADAGDLTLRSTSPCLPEQQPQCGLVGAYGVGCTPAGANDQTAARLTRDSPLIASVAPNPSSGPLRIELNPSAPEASFLRIVDAAGRRVFGLDESRRGATGRSILWNGRDASGRPVPGGVYFLVVGNGRDRGERRLVVLR